MNIALIGFNGTGKTSVCRLLAQKLGKKVVSTDDAFIKKTNLSASKYVKKHGIDKFREIESLVIEKMCEMDECIFDTHCSIVARNENIVNLKRNSFVVMLTSDLKTISSRIRSSGEIPLSMQNDYLNEVKDIFQNHEQKFMNAADFTIDTSSMSAEEACDLIAHYVQTELQ